MPARETTSRHWCTRLRYLALPILFIFSQSIWALSGVTPSGYRLDDYSTQENKQRLEKDLRALYAPLYNLSQGLDLAARLSHARPELKPTLSLFRARLYCNVNQNPPEHEFASLLNDFRVTGKTVELVNFTFLNDSLLQGACPNFDTARLLNILRVAPDPTLSNASDADMRWQYYQRLSKLFHLNNDRETALTMLDKAWDIKPQNPEPGFQQIMIHILGRNYDEGNAVLERIRELDSAKSAQFSFRIEQMQRLLDSKTKR